MKICNICSEEKPEVDYYRRSSGSLYGHCKACQNQMVRKGNRGGKKSNTPEQNRRHHAKRQFGLTLEEYDEMLGQPCGICGGESQAVDHCHKTGKIRGPLCRHCNLMLGHAFDDPARLRSAIKYLVG